MAKTTIHTEIDLNTTKFQRGLAKSKRSLSSFAKSGIGQMVKLGAAFAGIGLVKSIINLGTSAAETASKFDAVFGPAAGRMNERVLELKKTIPATTAEMQNALATFGAMGKAFGLNSDAANEFSVNMTKIAGDLASFHNLRPEEAFQKIQSAISGEFEPMKQLGIVMNEATLKQEALSLAIWDGTGQMSAAQKAITVQSLLIKQMGVAQGDAAATAESAANQIKFLQAKLKDTGAEIGNTILPAVTSLVGAFASLINGAKGASEAVGTFLAAPGGVADEDPLSGFREAAKRKLEREGRLLKTGKAGVSKHAQLNQINVEAKKLKKIHDERIKLKKDEIKVDEKVTDEVTDPARLKAADDYADSLQKQLDLAGKLEGITKQGAKPKSRAGSTTTTAGGTSTTTTSDEERTPDAGIRFEKTFGAGGEQFNQRFFGGRKAGRFSDGQLTGAAGSLQGALGAAGMPQDAMNGAASKMDENKTGKDPAESAQEQTELLESISETLSKLDGALSGD